MKSLDTWILGCVDLGPKGSNNSCCMPWWENRKACEADLRNAFVRLGQMFGDVWM